MHNDKSSAPTSAGALPDDGDLSEADYLAREAADAKAALVNSIADLRIGVLKSADLRAWVKHYPWAAIGTAAVTGFAAATAVTPARGQSLHDKLSTFHANGNSRAAEPATSPRESSATGGTAVKDKLVSSLFDLAKTAVQTILLATLRPPAPNTPPAEVAGTEPWQTRMAK
jgi:hypothetical protein